MKTLKSLIRSFFEDVVGTDNRFLFAVWILALSLILGFGFVLSYEPVSIQGVAESREYQVNFDNAVEIKHIYVLPNQIVKKGDLLIELNQTDLEQQLRVLKSRYDRLSAELKLRQQISRLTSEGVVLPLSADPLQVELTDTQREMSVIENRMRNLFVFAEVDGAVGTVNFKSGEKAPAFAPLITLVPLNPTYVNGYVNENYRSSVSVGEMVEVSSAGGKSVQGRVVSVGSRIVPIPQRLLRIQSLPAWGREVVVKIPVHNDFLLGEKVSVRKNWGLSLFSTAQADESESKWAAPAQVMIEDMNIPDSITEQFRPEISGLVYLPEVRQFAMISDDYPDSRPLILLMDSAGEVSSRMIPIENLDKMKDIESISLQGPYLYIMSSLSANKKNHLDAGRQMFVKVRREGLRFTLEKKMDLRLALIKALESSRDPVLKDIAARALGTEQSDLEVEGHAVQGDALYVALKRPVLVANQGIILKIESLEQMLETGSIDPKDLSVAARFQMPFRDPEERLSISDLIIDGDSFYIATSCHEQKCSAVWRLSPQSSRAELMQELTARKLEGIAIHPGERKIYGVFDSKKKFRLVTIPYAGVKRTE